MKLLPLFMYIDTDSTKKIEINKIAGRRGEEKSKYRYNMNGNTKCVCTVVTQMQTLCSHAEFLSGAYAECCTIRPVVYVLQNRGSHR